MSRPSGLARFACGLSFVLSFIALTALGLAAGPAAAAEKPIKIGFGMALTGPLAANGKIGAAGA